MAKKFGLGFLVLSSEEAFTALDLDGPLYLDGRLLSSKESEGVYNEMKAVVSSICAEAAKIANPYECWKTADADRLDGTKLSDWIAQQDCSPITRRAFEVQFTNTNGAGTAKQSFLANLAAIRGGALHGQPDDYFTQSETIKCEQGNDMLAKKLGEELTRAGGKLHLNSPITKIQILRERVIVTAAGKQFEADHAILAIPPSLWPDIEADADSSRNADVDGIGGQISQPREKPFLVRLRFVSEFHVGNLRRDLGRYGQPDADRRRSCRA